MNKSRATKYEFIIHPPKFFKEKFRRAGIRIFNIRRSDFLTLTQYSGSPTSQKLISYFRIFSYFAAILFLFSASIATAAQSRALITWQAQSFAPAEYPGKNLPSPGTNIKLGLEAIKENKLQDLSKINIRWYLDGKLLTQGPGLKETNFTVNKGATYSHFVRAVIMDKQEISGTVDIPIVSPKVIIKTPSPTDTSVPLGKTLFQAIPYFFNVANLGELIFKWSVNNQALEGNNLLELEITPPIPSNHNLNVRVTAQNLKNDLEFGTKEINLNVK